MQAKGVSNAVKEHNQSIQQQSARKPARAKQAPPPPPPPRPSEAGKGRRVDVTA